MTPECQVAIKRGALSFTRSDYDRFLSGVEAVVLLRDGDDLVILPVRHAHAGGYLLKQKNIAGDRVAHVAGFLRDQGVPDELEVAHTAGWSEQRAALVIDGFFTIRDAGRQT